jgi:hypothetical protein
VAQKRASIAVIERWENELVARVYVRTRGSPKLIAVRTGKPSYIETELPSLLRPAVYALGSSRRQR